MIEQKVLFYVEGLGNFYTTFFTFFKSRNYYISDFGKKCTSIAFKDSLTAVFGM